MRGEARPIETTQQTGQQPGTVGIRGGGDLRCVQAISGQQMDTGRQPASPETGRLFGRPWHGGNRLGGDGAIPAENRTKIWPEGRRTMNSALQAV